MFEKQMDNNCFKGKENKFDGRSQMMYNVVLFSF